MATKIDWISLTLPMEACVNTSPDTGQPIIRNGVRDIYPHITDWVSSFPDLTETGGNRIFDRGFRSSLGGFSIFQRIGRPFTLFEFTGQGVDKLREHRLHINFIRRYFDRLTRLDIASDFDSDAEPKDVALCRSNQRFKHYTDIDSEEGRTYYVGSKSSERFCRLYRYNPPHPRSHLLRAEFQLRSAYAKEMGEFLLFKSVTDAARNLIATFGLNHPVFMHLDNGEKIAAPRSGTRGGTERWLFQQVKPAIKRLIDEGQTEIIDLFLKEIYDLSTHRQVLEDNQYHGENLRSDPHWIT